MGSLLVGIVVVIELWLLPSFGDQSLPAKKLDVPYEPTHPAVVEAMLEVAGVTESDLLIDLGCGDGRIVIAAAKKYGARGVGIDLDPQRIHEANDNRVYEGVTRLVQFRKANILDADLHNATIVTMYLLKRVNLMLRPKLLRELRPGTRVVSHGFDMADWDPDRIRRHPKARGQVIYCWVIPSSVGGRWRWRHSPVELASANGNCNSGGTLDCTLKLTQQFQAVSGTLLSPGGIRVELSDVVVRGKELSFSAPVPLFNENGEIRYRGVVDGNTIRGTQEWVTATGKVKHDWVAQRDPVDLSGCWTVVPDFAEAAAGILCIARRDAGFIATYTVGSTDKPRLSLRGFYAWGSSVRFDLAGEKELLIFSGVLEDCSGDGVIEHEGWPFHSNWSAQRVIESANRSSAAPRGHGSEAVVQDATETGFDEYTNPRDGSVLVRIKGGRFFMGTNGGTEDERPRHEVAIAGFWLSKYEVTNTQYAKFLAANDDIREPMYWDDERFNQPSQPVIGVTWREARAYCEWADLRLPTEAEWEYAAAAGSQLRHPTATGEISYRLVNARGIEGADRWMYTSPVGSFPPNPFGLFDMAGNAWEWTSTAYAGYPYLATDGREETSIRKPRVLRGGSWHFPFHYCRTTARHRFAAHLRYDYAGIRVALTKPPEL